MPLKPALTVPRGSGPDRVLTSIVMGCHIAMVDYVQAGVMAVQIQPCAFKTSFMDVFAVKKSATDDVHRAAVRGCDLAVSTLH